MEWLRRLKHWAADNVPWLVGVGVVIIYLVRVWRISHYDVQVAAAVVRYQSISSLVAWIPQFVTGLVRLMVAVFLRAPTLSIIAQVLFAGAAIWVAMRGDRRRLIVSGLMLLAFVGFLIVTTPVWTIWQVSGFGCALLMLGVAVHWRLGGKTPEGRSKAILYGLIAALFILPPLYVAGYDLDAPWWPIEGYYLSSSDGSVHGLCAGWTLGEQGNGRWLVVMLIPDRSVVYLEASSIIARGILSEAEDRRVSVPNVEGGGQTETDVPQTNDEWRAECPGSTGKFGDRVTVRVPGGSTPTTAQPQPTS